MDARSAEKRGPSTPLAQSKTQNKRKFAYKADSTNSPLAFLGNTAPEYQAELLEAKYKMWLVQRELAKQKELTSFLELEREFL